MVNVNLTRVNHFGMRACAFCADGMSFYFYLGRFGRTNLVKRASFLLHA